MIEWCGRSTNKHAKGIKNELEKEKPKIKQGQAQEGSNL